MSEASRDLAKAKDPSTSLRSKSVGTWEEGGKPREGVLEKLSPLVERSLDERVPVVVQDVEGEQADLTTRACQVACWLQDCNTDVPGQ